MKHIASIGFLALAMSALAQVHWTKGKPVIGQRGIVESVREIMARPQPIYPYDKVIKFTEAEGPDRDNLPQNPLSPIEASFPPIPPGAEPNFRGPLFSLSNNWLGPVGGGTGSESPFVPPDTMGDVSPTQVMVTVNGRFKVYDRAGNLGSLNTDPNTFFASVRSTGMSDPRVRWDRLSQRWFIVMIDVASTNNRICIAVSNGPTVTSISSFTFYQFSYNIGGGSAFFLDYPTIGVDAKAIYIGGNIFTSSSGNFAQCDLFVVNKASLLSGGPLVVTPFRQVCTSSGVGIYTPHGCDNDDPNSNEGYVFGTSGNSFGLVKIKKVSDPGGSPSISSDFNITVPSTQNGRTAVALGSTGNLDALDDRIFAGKVFWNRLTNTPSIWAAHNVRGTSAGIASSSGDRDLSRWYEIRGFTGGGTPSLYQSGTVFSSNPAAHSYWIPSVAMNGQGHAVLGSSYAGTTVSPNCAFAYRFDSDPLGTMQPPVQITSSASTYNRQTGTQRWGDYSHTAVDPADGMSIWTFQEYCSAANQWGIRVSKLLAPPPVATDLSSPSIYPYDSVSETLAGSSLFEPGPSYPSHFSISSGASDVVLNSIAFVDAGNATFNAVVSGTATPGPRTITVTNPDGQTATTLLTVNQRSASGTISLANYPRGPSGIGASIEIRDAGSDALLQTAAVTLDVDGNFSFVPTVAPGAYSVYAKSSHWLRRKVAGVTVTPAGFSSVSFSLVNGDISGDNVVTLGDFAALRAALNSTASDPNWNPNADLNGDGAVTLGDFAILRASFGLAGD